MSKVVTMKETIVTSVEDGDLLCIGGYVCRTLFAAVRPNYDHVHLL
jgi:acyl CoA:acetate/3-ketoacid CoA transferase alpha subunit